MSPDSYRNRNICYQLMGCVCGKFSPPREERPRPPQVKRVASKEGSRTTRSSKHVGEGVKRETQRQRVSVSVNKDSTANDGGVVEGEKGKTVAKKGKTTKDLDVKEEKMAEYGFVDGWPKWLLDNIPANVLAKIVPKSADSFEKLAKVISTRPTNILNISLKCFRLFQSIRNYI